METTVDKKYIIIAFYLDRTINPCGTPCRSFVLTQTSGDAEEALRIGLFWEETMLECVGTDSEYHEVIVEDITHLNFESEVSKRINHVEAGL